MKSAAPRPKVFSVISSGESDETIRTGMSRQRESALSSCSSCTPSVPGMMTSSRSRSGGARCSSSNSVSRPVADDTSKPESRRTPRERIEDALVVVRDEDARGGHAVVPSSACRPSHSTLPPDRMHTVRRRGLHDSLEQRGDGDRAARLRHELVPVEQEAHRTRQRVVAARSRRRRETRDGARSSGCRSAPRAGRRQVRPGSRRSSRARRPRARA